MNVLVTGGPAWEPIDGMRRLTNASTGALGARLAGALAAAGHRVTFLRGELASAVVPVVPVGMLETLPFGTNDDLSRRLEEWPDRGAIGAVFHAAALCDFRVAAARLADGTDCAAAKIPTRSGRVILELEPATKVLARLRAWFPGARLVGWKYELNGTRTDALAAAWRQLEEARTDACVLNGRAWGGGFALCEPPDRVVPFGDGAALAAGLVRWLETGPFPGARDHQETGTGST
ncbi:MAG: DNA/pantothenate metabolism flavoprotein domain protein [Verrucomicrobiae bacterium]|nr:DNA/pantothenate metabolism flavoprotein domain protein [Verrucomicrobiae bacterium]